MRDAELLATIEQIYDAVTGTAGVGRLSSVLARAFDSPGCVIPLLALPPLGTTGQMSVVGLPSATEDMDGWARAAYAEHYHDRNIWFTEGMKQGFPAVVLTHEIVPKDRLLKSEWYDFCRKMNWFYCLGVQYRVDERLFCNLGLLRPRGAPAFNRDDKQTMEQLLPHIQRATQLFVRLGTAERDRAFSFEALETLGLGVLIVSEQAKLLYANRVAEQAMHDGSGLTVRKSCLGVSDPRKQPMLQRLVFEAALTSAGRGTGMGGTITLPAKSGALMVTVSPLCAPQHGLGFARPAAIVTFPASRQFSEDAVRRSYRLTEAEAKLLVGLLAGRTLADHAAAARISIETARTHMKRVFGKTGFHRQADLVRSVATNPLMWHAP